MALAVVAAILLTIVRHVDAISFYYVVIPRFELAWNTSSHLLPMQDSKEAALDNAVTDHLIAYSVNFSTAFQELRLNLGRVQYNNQSAKLSFSGYAVFDGATSSQFTGIEVANEILEPAFLSDVGSAELKTRIEDIPLAIDDLQVVVQAPLTMFESTFYYIQLPAFDVALKHRNPAPADLKAMTTSLQQQLRTHLRNMFQNTSKSAMDSLIDVYLRGRLSTTPFDASTSLYFCNYTDAVAVFRDTNPTSNYSMNYVFQQMVQQAFLSEYGYVSLVERLNQTEAWTGLLGLKILVENPYFEAPDLASGGQRTSLLFQALWCLAGASLAVIWM